MASKVAEGPTSEGGGGFNPRKFPPESISALAAAGLLHLAARPYHPAHRHSNGHRGRVKIHGGQ